MKLTEALKSKTFLEKKIEDLKSILVQNVKVKIPIDKDLAEAIGQKDQLNIREFEKIELELMEKLADLVEIKSKIQETNLSTIVNVPEYNSSEFRQKKCSLMESIIDLSHLRNLIETYKSLYSNSRAMYSSINVAKKDDLFKIVFQKSDRQINEKLESLLTVKMKIEKVIEETNHNTELIK